MALKFLSSLLCELWQPEAPPAPHWHSRLSHCSHFSWPWRYSTRLRQLPPACKKVVKLQQKSSCMGSGHTEAVFSSFHVSACSCTQTHTDVLPRHPQSHCPLFIRLQPCSWAPLQLAVIWNLTLSICLPIRQTVDWIQMVVLWSPGTLSCGLGNRYPPSTHDHRFPQRWNRLQSPIKCSTAGLSVLDCFLVCRYQEVQNLSSGCWGRLQQKKKQLFGSNNSF